MSLSPQPLRLLHLLVARRGEIVSHEDIRRTLWPEQDVDPSGRIHTAVRQIRRALGDDGVEPQYVETVPRLGYRFVAALNESTSCPDYRWDRIVGITAAGLALLAAVWFLTGSVDSGDASRVDASSVSGSDSDDAFLLGRSLLGTGNPHQMQRAIEQFERAAREDPDFAPAHANLSAAHLRLGDGEMARQHAAQAIELDSTYAAGHLRRANVLGFVDWNWSGANASLATALELTPEAPEIHMALARVHLLNGDAAAADSLAALAESLDPDNPEVTAAAARVAYLQGRFDAAKPRCERALALDARYLPARECVYRIALLGKDFDTAKAAAIILAEQLGADAKVIARIRSQPASGAAIAFEKWYLSQENVAARQPVRAAIANAIVQHNDEALFLLRRAMGQRSPQLPLAMVDPILIALHHQSAFERMRREMGVSALN